MEFVEGRLEITSEVVRKIERALARFRDPTRDDCLRVAKRLGLAGPGPVLAIWLDDPKLRALADWRVGRGVPYWTPAEDEVLKSLYRRGASKAEMDEALPGRPTAVRCNRARRLGFRWTRKVE